MVLRGHLQWQHNRRAEGVGHAITEARTTRGQYIMHWTFSKHNHRESSVAPESLMAAALGSFRSVISATNGAQAGRGRRCNGGDFSAKAPFVAHTWAPHNPSDDASDARQKNVEDEADQPGGGGPDWWDLHAQGNRTNGSAFGTCGSRGDKRSCGAQEWTLKF